MNNMTLKLLKNGNVPIMSSEGISILLATIIAYYKSNKPIGVQNSLSRTIKLSSYKRPLDEKEDIQNDISCVCNIIQYLLQSIENNYNKYGFQFVKKDISHYHLDLTEQEFVRLLHFDMDIVKHAIETKQVETLPKFIQILCESSMIFGDRSCKPSNLPYECEHKSSYDHDYRIYINTCNGSKRNQFLELYVKKCIDRRIPFEMKGREKTDFNNRNQDRTVLYVFEEYLEDSLKILEEIAEENTELVQSFGSPITTGYQYSFFSLCSRGKRTATYNMFFDRLSENAFSFTIAQLIIKDSLFMSKLNNQQKEIITMLSNIKSYEAYLSKPSSINAMKVLTNDIIKDYIKSKNNKELINNQTIQIFQTSLLSMASYTNFGDYKHTNYPICFNHELFDSLNHSKEMEKAERMKEFDSLQENDSYLYHTEELFEAALHDFMKSNLSNREKVLQYIHRIAEIEKKFRQYAIKTQNFPGSNRYKKVIEFLKQLPRFEMFVEDSKKGNGINMVNSKRYYDDVAAKIESFYSNYSSSK